MKTIGLLGGMSWESSLHYYRLVNEMVRHRLGGLHSARVERLLAEGRWDELGRALAEAAALLGRGGADFIVLCTNTMHRVADAVAQGARVPLLHIADATAKEVRARGLGRVGLLGTRFTMEQAFYRERLAERHGLDVLVPAPAEREVVHRVIFDELCVGQVRESSRRRYLEIIEGLRRAGAEGVILGCTEIAMLVRPEDVDLPVFDTTEIHARAAVDLALAEGPG